MVPVVNMEKVMALFARRLDTHLGRKYSVYGKDYELCEGTDDLTMDEMKELVRDWDEREVEDYGTVISTYKME